MKNKSHTTWDGNTIDPITSSAIISPILIECVQLHTNIQMHKI